MKHLSIGIPILASLAAFVLVLLALLAGSNPGYMENYDVLTFNTSGLGKNLVSKVIDDDTPSSTTSGGLCNGVDGFLGRVCGSATAAAGSAESAVVDAFNDIGNDIADKLADRLGIHEFYSLHALTICEGDFSPNATSSGAGRNVSSCEKGLSNGYNISAKLDQELRVGPLDLRLSDLGFTKDIQDAVDTLNKVTKAFAIILIVGVALTGLALLASLISLFLVSGRERGVFLANAVLSALAFFVLLISGLIVTIASRIAVDKVNDMGDDIGLQAAAGNNYTIITWVAVGLMLVAFVYWVSQLVRFRKGKIGRGAGARYNHKHVRDSEDTAGRPSRDNRPPQMRSVRGGVGRGMRAKFGGW
ncbi:actin cortical patch SUR7/pH-response regulator pali [Apodospora peruviana]|uniref:Actin cortical patch SUR7/pH-response regulator pali n=1 Tax=Apodospora peruviana TaxID=516989 RepID=A0AAE0IRH8_9PEZI|nr:actin cortical patch SUR7/pH-response regulator pali [Apodospora peruviana]